MVNEVNKRTGNDARLEWPSVKTSGFWMIEKIDKTLFFASINDPDFAQRAGLVRDDFDKYLVSHPGMADDRFDSGDFHEVEGLIWSR